MSAHKFFACQTRLKRDDEKGFLVGRERALTKNRVIAYAAAAEIAPFGIIKSSPFQIPTTLLIMQRIQPSLHFLLVPPLRRLFAKG